MGELDIELLGSLLLIQRREDYCGALARLDMDSRQRKSLHGTVLAAGPGKPLPDGGAAPMNTHVGDHVIFGEATGIESEYLGRRLLICKDEDIDAVIE